MPRILIIFLCATIISCKPSGTNSYPETYSVEIENPLSESRKDVSICIQLAEMHDGAGFMVRSNEVQLASEHLGDSVWVYLDSMKANEKRTITIYYNNNPTSESIGTRKRTQAELSYRIEGNFFNVFYMQVPPQHKVHDDFIRYEGPGWESEKVAYRLYLDERNAIDVFGKKTPDMILLGVGQDGSPSYHEMQPWGMDIMKVGESLGLGSIGMWNDSTVLKIQPTDSVLCEVRDGAIRSSVIIGYGHVVSTLSINAGSRLTQHQVTDTTSLCTGIIKDPAAKVFKKEATKNSFGYLATYGKQSLNNDNLGLVVLFPAGTFHEDNLNYVVELAPGESLTEYYFGAAWELEPDGITSEKDFIKWVEKSARELANPVIVHEK